MSSPQEVPDVLLRDVLEQRQDELIAAYAESDNQEEIALELAEISVSLEQD